MHSQRWQLIYNPTANRGRGTDMLNRVIPILSSVATVDVYATTARADALEAAAASAADNYDVVIAMGGDGTVSEVVNGLMTIDADARPAFAVIPNGSGNDFAWAAGLSEGAERAAHRIVELDERRIDVGAITNSMVGTRYFVNSVGMFMVAAIGIRAAELRRLHGLFMYLVATLQTIVKDYSPVPVRLTVDDRVNQHTVVMLSIGNGSREGGGFLTNPPADIGDGELNFTFSTAISRLRMLALLPTIMRGSHACYDNFQMGVGRNICLESDAPVPIHVDGEIWTRPEDGLKRFEIVVLNGALRLLS
jgi:diacylglycerol kinase (ATP)